VADSATDFHNELLLANLARLPTPLKYWVGFSGGADSTALLQAMHECREQLAAPLHAVHFHHGLQSQADAWLDHCRAFCEARDLPYRAERLKIDGAGRSSPEEAAREQRYLAVAGLLGPQEMYLTAHHAEDLAETLFLNLMRGSGVEGLAGIPVLRNLANGWVGRPLLETRRRDLENYLASRGIDWLTDPSNADLAFDRNYLRQELFPLLERRWPGLVQRLSRTARNARITAGAMALFIERQSGELLQDPLRMPLAGLLALEQEMQTLILRQWLRRHEVPMLPEQRLREFLKQLMQGGPDSQAEVRWQGWMLKRYHSDLWLHGDPPCEPCPRKCWRAGPLLELGSSTGTLALGGGEADIPPGWRIRPRLPGDRIRLQATGSRQKIKHLFQAAAIPPWLRSAVPVLEWEGEPVALGDCILGHRLRDWLVENRLQYEWRPADPVLARLRSDCHRRVVDRGLEVG
jgi:tRNA(Ile)-lysidine synthase